MGISERLKHYYAATWVISVLGLLDALAAAAQGVEFFRQAFSLLEVLWVPVSLLLLAVCRRHGYSVVVPAIFLGYQLAAWFYGRWLLTVTGQLILPPWFSGVAFLLYAVLAWLSWQQYRGLGSR